MSRVAVIVIPAAQLDAANAACAEIEPKQSNTFRAVFSADGKRPVTHYACHWTVTDEQWDALLAVFGPVMNKYSAKVYTGEQRSASMALSAERLKAAVGVEGES